MSNCIEVLKFSKKKSGCYTNCFIQQLLAAVRLLMTSIIALEVEALKELLTGISFHALAFTLVDHDTLTSVYRSIKYHRYFHSDLVSKNEEVCDLPV
ncbi:uncharacterized protein LOC104900349 isoform X3 [Beta vulgaris subsp. vulgaris]|uniref:uncharacterized protein LOC104900349 isoform X3 n=1 Tax=Beta vulgaris subsp. vulgaris TaxID=3555 RepID=UPI002549357D|nr:uncharacterized protein LOC104900349 isoform X3 [Beta vulgaris subsp. vulgaris]